MDSTSRNIVAPHATILPRYLPLVVITLGSAVMVGWALEVDALKRVWPGLVSMNPLTAIGFILSGFSLSIFDSQRRSGKSASLIAACLVLIIGALQLLQSFTGIGLYIDRLLFTSALDSPIEPEPNQMAPTTAFNFLCMGAALVALHLGRIRAYGTWVAEAFAILALIVSSLAIVGYVYGLRVLYGLSVFIPMAIHTAAGFFIMSLAIIGFCHRSGMLAIFRKFFWKLYGGYIVLIFVSTALVGVLIKEPIQNTLEQNAERLLRTACAILYKGVADKLKNQQPIVPDSLSIPAALKPENVSLTVLDSKGRPLYDSRTEPLQDLGSEPLSQPEILSALANDPEVAIRQEADGSDTMYFALPVFQNQALTGFIRAGAPMSLLHQEVNGIRIKILLGTLMGAGLALLLGLLVARNVTSALDQIRVVARRLSEGDYTSRAPVTGDDEITELAFSFNAMADTISSQIVELKEARRAAEAAAEAKSSFLAHMSHEIRTPLNGVIGMLELLQRTTLDEKQQKYLDVAKSSGHALTDLISDILDLTKIEAGKLVPEPANFDLYEVIEEAIEVVAPRAAEKPLELLSYIQPDLSSYLRGDGARLRQVLLNLLSNAVKFTEKGHVMLRVSKEGQVKSRVLLKFEVTDSGIGIPEDKLAVLFQPFSQVDTSSTRVFGGTGLGLAISRELVQLMGGDIGVRSEEGKGSTFWFTMPFQQKVLHDEGAKSSKRDPRSIRVLVADNSENFRAVLVEQLTSWGMHVKLTNSGEGALKILRDQKSSSFDVALIDRDLPDMDGIRLGEEIRLLRQAPQLTLLLFTKMGDEPSPEELERAGFNGCLTKPVRQSRLLDLIMDKISLLRGPLSDRASKISDGTSDALSSKQIRILLAEDNPSSQIVAGEILKYLGYSYSLVETGTKALNEACTGKYDLVIMDCQMPEMDGFEATQKIREHEKANGSSHIPIIALTANAIGGDKERCLNAGMDAYCSKPVNPDELGSVINSLLSRATNGGLPASESQLETKNPLSERVPFDLRALYRRCANNYAAVQKVLSQFEAQIYRDLADISLHLGNGDAQAIARSAHSLLGSAGLASAEGFVDVLTQIEAAAKAGDLQAVREKITALKREGNRCLIYMPEAQHVIAIELHEEI
ncbi:MAG: response regulator [Deltaproteobacteria bacterium]|nr:response regulator [Deltaproteobacteria bacterium]